MHSQPALNQQPKVNPYTKFYPCCYHKASCSLILCPATSNYFSRLEFQYLPSELIRINFQLEPHNSVPKPERGPRQKARALVRLIMSLHSRLRVLCYLSMPENSKNLIFYVSFSICIFRCFIYFVRFHSFCQESKSTIIPLSWPEAEVNDDY